MSEKDYQPDQPRDAVDALIVMGSAAEPPFDAVMRDFLREGHSALSRQCAHGGLLSFRSLGARNPWLYRLDFHTYGLSRDSDKKITQVDRHVVALRFLPDYLRHADRFAMLRLVEPGGTAFHPNISPSGAICIEIYPGEPLLEICHSLHDLFRWRLRQYDERDALNPTACAWGRDHVAHPIDERPLFGQRTNFQWQPAVNGKGP
jgi:hypothetical protein